jgi:hypothetical protein
MRLFQARKPRIAVSSGISSGKKIGRLTIRTTLELSFYFSASVTYDLRTQNILIDP